MPPAVSPAWTSIEPPPSPESSLAPAAFSQVPTPATPSATMDRAVLTATPSQQAAMVQGRREPAQSLIAFGLLAAGVALGMASLFLPWAGATGIGIGTTGSSPPPNQWGWGMPASLPLALLTALVLGATLATDGVTERLPRVAPMVVRLTELVMPMILGGIYLGVGLMYLTLPWGYGSGVMALLLSAVLLIAGGVVTLLFPPDGAKARK